MSGLVGCSTALFKGSESWERRAVPHRAVVREKYGADGGAQPHGGEEQAGPPGPHVHPAVPHAPARDCAPASTPPAGRDEGAAVGREGDTADAGSGAVATAELGQEGAGVDIPHKDLRLRLDISRGDDGRKSEESGYINNCGRAGGGHTGLPRAAWRLPQQRGVGRRVKRTGTKAAFTDSFRQRASSQLLGAWR